MTANLTASYRPLILLFALLLALTSCQDEGSSPMVSNTRFQLLPAKTTGIDFSNDLSPTEEYNMYTYRNFYNGGGVALGDVNNDGLLDVFFCGNQVENKLYLNKGNFEFEDVTKKAGVAVPNIWTSGASMVDINGDGWLDLYLTKSGKPGGAARHNELFINQQDGTFLEASAKWGINTTGLSVHSAFFDFDRDGDLDLYLLNNSIRSVGGYDIVSGLREIRDTLGGNRLYRNEGDHFTDVSAEAGIYGSAIGFGLGVSIGDLNRDGWPDIYVSNDYFERDYLYINNQDGTFTEDLENRIREHSLSSMGADVADINNDGLPEIFVTDMLPESERRFKTKTRFENWNKYQLNVKNGYAHQFTRNSLQFNQGDGRFSEISRLAGVEATDWSWGALLFDMDNDRRTDIFVANGIAKDLTDQDYVNFFSSPEVMRALQNRQAEVILHMIDSIPSEPIANYAFQNQAFWEFDNRAADWGLDQPSFSNGSAYGDLDNDGDLDLIINNVDQAAFVYRNNSRDSIHANYLQFSVKGSAKNTHGIGTQISLFKADEVLFRELHPMRGFESTVDHRITFGLGDWTTVDSVYVLFPQGSSQILTNVTANQQLILHEKDGTAPSASERSINPYFAKASTNGLDFRHVENEFRDFDRDPMLFHELSHEGPAAAKGDFNGDGLEDLFLGGARGQASALWLQTPSGKWQRGFTFDDSQESEAVAAEAFDANGDGRLDLYVANGGNEFGSAALALSDALYLNMGKGVFKRSPQVLPTSNAFTVSSCVRAADVDLDGDIDLFVGSRQLPQAYGVPPDSYLLLNDGQGNFKIANSQAAAALSKLGMVTDAQWTDFDQDGDSDLVVIGEYMPITLFENTAGRLTKRPSPELEAHVGWWNRLEVADLNNDQKPDFIVGNCGRNSRLTFSKAQPLRMYVNDFDQNRTVEQLLTVYNGDRAYPFVLLHDLTKQLPGLRKQYLKYAQYQGQQYEDIFPETVRKRSIEYAANQPNSCVFYQTDAGWTVHELPVEAQLSSVYGIAVDDWNGDGLKDLLLTGNFHQSKPEVGSYDGSYGSLLLGTKNGQFESVSNTESGLNLRGAIRDIIPIRKPKGSKEWWMIKNDGTAEPIVARQ